MYIDDKLEMSDAQAITSTGLTASEDVIDTGLADSNYGPGDPMWLVVEVHTDFTSGGAGTLAVSLQDSADNSTFASILTSATHALASLKQGFAVLKVPLPAKNRRYLRIGYTVGTAAMTAGKVNAFLTRVPESY